MTEAEKLKRDINTVRETIRLNWLELTKIGLTPEESRDVRASIEAFTSDLFSLIRRLDEL